jgi:hypothetical protein
MLAALRGGWSGKEKLDLDGRIGDSEIPEDSRNRVEAPTLE